MKNKKGNIFIWGGLLLIVAALSLTGYNLWDEYRALQEANALAKQLQGEIAEVSDGEEPADETDLPDYVLNPDMEMPVITVDGLDYIGVLEIPSQNLVLPVISEWSYPALRVGPCRYLGSAYRDNLIIAAHNYQSHFGLLNNLVEGDRIAFTDMDGNVFVYNVVLWEILEPTAVEEMESGGWDLTLFTCTLGGQSRVVIRCEKG